MIQTQCYGYCTSQTEVEGEVQAPEAGSSAAMESCRVQAAANRAGHALASSLRRLRCGLSCNTAASLVLGPPTESA